MDGGEGVTPAGAMSWWGPGEGLGGLLGEEDREVAWLVDREEDREVAWLVDRESEAWCPQPGTEDRLGPCGPHRYKGLGGKRKWHFV